MQCQASDLFCLDVAENIMTELFRTAEEPRFIDRETCATSQLQFKQLKHANEIGNLEESIFLGFDRLRKFNRTWQVCCGHATEIVGYHLLAAIVIDFNAFKGGETFMIAGGEVGELVLKGFGHLSRFARISLVNRETVIREIYLAGERHHPIEYPPSKVSSHETKSVVAAHYRPSVETDVLDFYFLKSLVKHDNCGFYREPLVMQDQSEDIETRCLSRFAKDSRFVYKQAQYVFLYHNSINKSDGNRSPSLRAEDFPRTTTTPILESTSTCIIPDQRTWYNKKSKYVRNLWAVGCEEEAA